jgi:hypothetical protein
MPPTRRIPKPNSSLTHNGVRRLDGLIARMFHLNSQKNY